MTWTELHGAVKAHGVTADVLRSARALMKAPPEMIAAYNDALMGAATMPPEAEAEAKCMVSVLARITPAIKDNQQLANVWEGRE